MLKQYRQFLSGASVLVMILATSVAHASSFDFTSLDVPTKSSGPSTSMASATNDGAMVGEFVMAKGDMSDVLLAAPWRNRCWPHGAAEPARVTA